MKTHEHREKKEKEIKQADSRNPATLAYCTGGTIKAQKVQLNTSRHVVPESGLEPSSLCSLSFFHYQLSLEIITSTNVHEL
jgi:hypothetical protein